MSRLRQSGLALLLALLPSAARADGIQSQSSITSLQDTVTNIFSKLIFIFPLVATLYLVLSGYRYIVAQGNQDLVEKAKKSLLYAVFGVVITYAAVAIIFTVGKALGYNP